MTERTVVLKCGNERKTVKGTEKEILHASTTLGKRMHGGYGCKRVDIVDEDVYDRYPQHQKNTVW